MRLRALPEFKLEYPQGFARTTANVLIWERARREWAQACCRAEAALPLDETRNMSSLERECIARGLPASNRNKAERLARIRAYDAAQVPPPPPLPRLPPGPTFVAGNGAAATLLDVPRDVFVHSILPRVPFPFALARTCKQFSADATAELRRQAERAWGTGATPRTESCVRLHEEEGDARTMLVALGISPPSGWVWPVTVRDTMRKALRRYGAVSVEHLMERKRRNDMIQHTRRENRERKRRLLSPTE